MLQMLRAVVIPLPEYILFIQDMSASFVTTALAKPNCERQKNDLSKSILLLLCEALLVLARIFALVRAVKATI